MPCLWFDNQAEKAAGKPEGLVMTIEFQINGQKYILSNGAPYFKFSEAVSFIVNCETQDRGDYLWENLSAGGEEGQGDRPNHLYLF